MAPNQGARYLSGMEVPERIHAYLTSRTPEPVCDDCISKGAGVTPRNQVNPITRTLGLTTDFMRVHGVCADCKSDKLVTRSLRHA